MRRPPFSSLLGHEGDVWVLPGHGSDDPKALARQWTEAAAASQEQHSSLEENLLVHLMSTRLLALGYHGHAPALIGAPHQVNIISDRLHNFPLRTCSTTMVSLGNEQLELRYPIIVTLEDYGDEVIASWPEIEARGCGITDGAAINALKDTIADLYWKLTPRPDDKLGKLPSRRKRALLAAVKVLEAAYQPQFVDAVAAAIRERCAKLHGVDAAWMRPDGTDFILTGPVWTPELSEAGAALAVELRDRFAPACDPLIEGGYMDQVRPIEGWVMVYP